MFFFTEGNVLSWATFFPLIGSGLIVVLLALGYLARLPKSTTDQVSRVIALVTSGLSLLAAVAAWVMYDGSKAGMQLQQHLVWIRSFNIEYYVGADGISISMILLSGLISFVATIASMNWWSGKKDAEMAGMVEHDHGHGHEDVHDPK